VRHSAKISPERGIPGPVNQVVNASWAGLFVKHGHCHFGTLAGDAIPEVAVSWRSNHHSYPMKGGGPKRRTSLRDRTPPKPLETLELRVLFVGSKEEDFYIVRDVLRLGVSTVEAELDQAFSLEEASETIATTAYDVVLFDGELCKQDHEHFEVVAEQLKNVSFVLLQDGEADEAGIAQILQMGAAD
jgi:hypothetical protein